MFVACQDSSKFVMKILEYGFVQDVMNLTRLKKDVKCVQAVSMNAFKTYKKKIPNYREN